MRRNMPSHNKLKCLLAGALICGLLPILAEPAAAQAPGFPGDYVCAHDRKPVCVRKNGRDETYPSACLAKLSGYRIVAQGACASGCAGPYRPVCGDRGGLRMTYANKCAATQSGAKVVHGGPCR
jgi:hypothetical protein